MNSFPLVPLAQVLTLANRAEPTVPGVIYRQLGVRLWGRGAYERERINGSDTRYKTLSRVQTDDIVVNKIWARNGSVAVVPRNLSGCYVSGEFPTFAPVRARLDPRWFHWLTKMSDFWSQCDAKSRGTSGKNRIRPERFLEIEIPLAPLEEQRRILARVEELDSRIAEIRSLRRQAMLDTDALTRAALVQMNEDLTLLGFPRKKIGRIAKVTSGGTPSREVPSYWGGNIPWVTSGELLDGDIYETEQHITKDGLDNSSAKLFPPGTILVGLYGQGQTRGRTAQLMIEASTNQACCAILPVSPILEPRFIQYWLRGLYNEMRAQSRDGAQPNWNGKMIKNVEIAIPPLAEQLRIVDHLNYLQKKTDSLRRQQTRTASEIETLLLSILDKAFNVGL